MKIFVVPFQRRAQNEKGSNAKVECSFWPRRLQQKLRSRIWYPPEGKDWKKITLNFEK